MRDDAFLFGTSNICFSYLFSFLSGGSAAELPATFPLSYIARWSSPVARRSHNPKVTGSNPVLATLFGEINLKEQLSLLKITRDERDYLEKECGCVFGRDLHKTYSSHPHYYVTENRKILRKLYQYRESRIKK